jgi:PhnB protein
MVSQPVFLASWHEAMRNQFPRYLSGELTYQDQRRARMRQTVSIELTDVQADELFADYARAYEAHWALFSDVLTCLDGLTEHRLGTISNGNGSEQRRKLERTGIATRFEAIHISSEFGQPKPAAEIFHRACRDAGVGVRDAVYIGDAYEIDALGARRAGLQRAMSSTPNSDTVARCSIAPMLSVRSGARAVDFYKAAFGASEVFHLEDPGGSVVARLSIEGAEFWLSDESPENSNFSPASLGGSTTRMILTVPDPDGMVARARAAGAREVIPVTEAHGWRLGRVEDPYGHHWEIGRPL